MAIRQGALEDMVRNHLYRDEFIAKPFPTRQEKSYGLIELILEY